MREGTKMFLGDIGWHASQLAFVNSCNKLIDVGKKLQAHSPKAPDLSPAGSKSGKIFRTVENCMNIFLIQVCFCMPYIS